MQPVMKCYVLSRRLLHCLRDTDTLARPADEFTAVLEGIHQANDATVVAQRMLLLAPLALYDHQQIFMSASIGIALYPTDAVEAATLLKFADVAMYRAKEQGKQFPILFGRNECGVVRTLAD